MGMENGASESKPKSTATPPPTTTKSQTHLIFTYGTLKRSFWNHTLLQDLIRTGDAVFKGTSRTLEKHPLVCGPFKVPFLLNFPGVPGSRTVSGELYAVSAVGLARVDELEGTDRGHYERLPIEVVDGGGNGVLAEAYFAHRNFAAEMWRRNGKRGLGEYTIMETKGYVKRKDRPQNVSFLDQIHAFITSSDDDN